MIVVSKHAQETSLRAVVSDALILRLYVNDREPQEKDGAAEFTEAAGFGYTPIVLIPGEWLIDRQSSPMVLEYPEREFKFTGPLGKVFGYFLTQQFGSKLMWAERFSSGNFDGYTVRNSGDRIFVTPRISQRNEKHD